MSVENGGNIFGLTTLGNSFAGRGLANVSAFAGRNQVDISVDGTTIGFNAQNKLKVLNQSLKPEEPEYYGAVGDGSTDDTIAVQACIDASEGLVVFKNTYVVSALSIKSNTVYQGPGTIKAKVGTTNDSDTSVLYGDNYTNGSGTYPTDTLTNVTFDGITFDGNTARQSNGTVTYMHSYMRADNLKFVNCHFVYIGGYGIRINGKYTIADFAGAYNYPTADVYCDRILVQGCTFSDAYLLSGGSVSFGGTAVQFVGVRNSVIANNEFINCCLGAGVDFLNTGISVTGNVHRNSVAALRARATGVPAFYVGQASTGITVTGNTMLNSGWIGIYVESAGYINISGNVIKRDDGDYNTYGICVSPTSLWTYALSCTDVTVSNNVVQDSETSILVGSTLLAMKNAIVTHNLVKNDSGSAQPGITSLHVSQLNISGNNIDASGGTFFNNCTHVLSSGNSVYNATTGVYIQGASSDHIRIQNDMMLTPRVSSKYLHVDYAPAHPIYLIDVDTSTAATPVTYSNGASSTDVVVSNGVNTDTSGNSTFGGDITFSGNAIVSGSSKQIQFPNFKLKAESSPLAGTLRFGDGTGWQYKFQRNDGSSTYLTMYDSGYMAFAGTVEAAYFACLGTGSFGGALSMSSNKITSLATCTAGTDAANKAYVDAISVGIHPKTAVVATSTANVSVSSAPSSVDGVSLTSGGRVLLNNQSTAMENGVYTFTSAGSALTRATDFANGTSAAGFFVFTTGGSTNSGIGYIVTNAGGSDVINTNALVFVQFLAAPTYTYSTGLTNTAGTVTVNAAQSQITSVGTLSSLTMGGALDMGSHLINHVTTPVASDDAATKGYVDGAVVSYSAGSNLQLSGTTLSLNANPSITSLTTSGALSISGSGDPRIKMRESGTNEYWIGAVNGDSAGDWHVYDQANSRQVLGYSKSSGGLSTPGDITSTAGYHIHYKTLYGEIVSSGAFGMNTNAETNLLQVGYGSAGFSAALNYYDSGETLRRWFVLPKTGAYTGTIYMDWAEPGYQNFNYTGRLRLREYDTGNIVAHERFFTATWTNRVNLPFVIKGAAGKKYYITGQDMFGVSNIEFKIYITPTMLATTYI